VIGAVFMPKPPTLSLLVTLLQSGAAGAVLHNFALTSCLPDLERFQSHALS
jgi:hypothetical protein